MKTAVIIPLALAVVVLTSGCTDIHQFPENADRTTMDAADLIENPAGYHGQVHVIMGRPVKAEGELFGYYISSGEEKLYLNFTGFECEECIISGSVERVAVCDCLAASCNGADCEPPDDGWEFLDVRPPDECEDKIATMVLGNLVVKNFFRCGPGTEKYMYYLQVYDSEESNASP